MKKLMIGLVGALAMVASAEVASENIVGYKNFTVPGGARGMRSASTFLKTGANPLAITLSDIKRISGDPMELTLCRYNDNVTRLSQYIYFSDEVIAGIAEEMGMNLGSGWYILDGDEPDFAAGPQDTPIPYGQGCVIESSSSSAEYNSAGEVDSIKREFSILGGARKMMGNVLPRAIMLSELKQTVGDPGELVFCTYDDNVTRKAQYMYFSEEVAAGVGEEIGLTLGAGWYLIGDEDVDFAAGPQDFEIPSGMGFVVESSSESALLQFPMAVK